MLAEIQNARQIPNEGTRRWFRDEELDLIVWYDDSSEIAGFQLCYDKHVRERALTWRKSGSYQHHAIDPGEVAGHNKMTPILVADGVFDKDRISKLFTDKSVKIEADLSQFVLEKLNHYSESRVKSS